MDSKDTNKIFVAVTFQQNKNQKEIGAAIINTDKRSIYLCEFTDEEHFSNFEALLLQTNPNSDDEKFTLYYHDPELDIEKEKIQDIIETSGIHAVLKQKKEFNETGIEDRLNNLLKTPLKQHVVESTLRQALKSLALLITALKLDDDESNFKQFSLSQYILSQIMKLDLAAINALQIFPKQNEQKLHNTDGNCATLLDLLDKCKTQIGSRTLKRWLKQPLQDPAEIKKRLDLVEMFYNVIDLRKYLTDEFFKKVADLDKLYAKFYKVHSKKPKHGADLGDIIKVYSLVTSMRHLVEHIQSQKYDENMEYGQLLTESILQPLEGCTENFGKLEPMIEQGIDLELATKGEYSVNPKFTQTLQDLNKLIIKTKKKINALVNETSDDLGINVKLVDSTSYLFLFEAKKKDADDAFRKKGGKGYKTITVKKNLLSFTTKELQAECVELESLKDEYATESKQVVDKLLTIVSTYYPAMEETSMIVSQLDVLCAFANLAESSNYVKPIINEEIESLKLQDSKHACLDANTSSCISNNCQMDYENSRFHIITGPNMGGKSTYIRQVAICVLLAHIGCYVPASKAEIPIIDAIITRVGASDMQLRGISTFMSEMLEASCMLKIATQKSLIVIDELGRGTSTSEGFGIAWAISEYIVKQIGCYCLFATHFHEMVKMAEQIKGVENYHVTCLTSNNSLTMQYKVKQGFAERSYGLYVAEILQFPDRIIRDAQEKLQQLENFGQEEQENGQGDIELEYDENINTNNIDLRALAKNATGQQQEKIIKLTQQFYEQYKDEQDQQKVIDELKNRVIQILKEQ